MAIAVQTSSPNAVSILIMDATTSRASTTLLSNMKTMWSPACHTSALIIANCDATDIDLGSTKVAGITNKWPSGYIGMSAGMIVKMPNTYQLSKVVYYHLPDFITIREGCCELLVVHDIKGHDPPCHGISVHHTTSHPSVSWCCR